MSMNRKHRVRLGALSKIDDKILDRASAQRYRLLSRRRLKKLWIWISASAACLAILLSSILLIPLLGKQVPVYRGMTVSGTSPLTQASNALPEDLTDRVQLLSLDVPAPYPEAVFLKTDNPNASPNGQNPAPPEEELPEETEEEIKSSLLVVGAGKELYYAQPMQDIYITVHIDNPDQYEIQSFTLNGKKYSSYMFEKGSDMENLVLKVNVGDVAGYVEYTIDAIKYIDGTEIKDVRFDGDRTVRVGVWSDNQPVATVTDERADFTSISFAVTLTDPLSLVGASDGKLGAVLLDGEDNLLDAKLLALGENRVTFGGLSVDTVYRYGVVGYYDDLADEDGIDLHILYEKTVTTPRDFAIESVTESMDGVRFATVWNESTTVREITAIAIYRGDEKVRDLPVDATSADDLLSNTAYTLRISFVSDAGEGVLTYDFTTRAKVAPTVTLLSSAFTTTTVSGSLSVTDDDGTLIAIESVKLCQNTETVCDFGAQTSFSAIELTPYTTYTLRITYSFDLSDGQGAMRATKEIVISTSAVLQVTSIIPYDSSETDTSVSRLIVRLNNPARVEISAIKINGTSCEIEQGLSSFTSLVVKLGELEESGEVTLRVTDLTYDLYGTRYTETGVSDDAALDIFIHEPIVFKSLSFVDKEGRPTNYCFPSSRAELLLEISNPADYSITGVVINYTVEIPASSVTKVGDGLYRIAMPADTNGYWGIERITIDYGNEHFSDSLTDGFPELSDQRLTVCMFLSSDTVRYISSAADLQAITYEYDTYYYYQQTQDIDLSGLKWFGPRLGGVYDGNGYKIKNMQHVGEYGFSDTLYSGDFDSGNFGLFNSAYGIVKNVTLSNATMMVKFGPMISIVGAGALVGQSDYMLTLENCTLEESCLFRFDASEAAYSELEAEDVYVGSIWHYYENINCTDRSDYNLTTPDLDF